MDLVCISMPQDLQKFMLAMAVVQDIQLQYATGEQRKERDSFQVTFRMSEKFKCFEPALRVVKNNVPIFDYSGWDEEQRGDFDCYIKFDDEMFDRASKIAKTIGSNIVHGLNTLVGAGATIYPILNALQLTRNESLVTDVLITNWGNAEDAKLYEFIFNNYPQLNIIHDNRDWNNYKPEELLEYINHFNCVIGPMGLSTYIAGTLKKVVLEVFKTTEDGKLYSAVGTPGYNAVVGKSVTAIFLWTTWEDKLWPELLLKTKSHAELDSTGSHPAIAENVEGKSGDNSTPKSEQ